MDNKGVPYAMGSKFLIGLRSNNSDVRQLRLSSRVEVCETVLAAPTKTASTPISADTLAAVSADAGTAESRSGHQRSGAKLPRSLDPPAATGFEMGDIYSLSLQPPREWFRITVHICSSRFLILSIFTPTLFDVNNEFPPPLSQSGMLLGGEGNRTEFSLRK